MARKFIFRNCLLPGDGTLPIELGGTAANNAPEAAKNLGIVSSDQAGAPYGIILLDKDGNLDKQFLPPNFVDPSIVCLYGPFNVPVGRAQRYKITNFDSSTVYIATATQGSVVIVGEDVTFTASNTIGKGSIVINGKTYVLEITDRLTTTPTIRTPLNDAKLTTTSVTYNSSEYVPLDDDDIHQASDWELALDRDFKEIQYATYDDRINKIAWTPVDLQEYTEYYCRVRYRNATGNISDWSAVKHVTTGNDDEINFPVQFILAKQPERYNISAALYENGARLAIAEPGQTLALYRSISGIFTADGTVPTPTTAIGTSQWGMSLKVSPNGKYMLVLSGATSTDRKLSVLENIGGTWTHLKTTAITDAWAGASIAISNSSPHSSGRPFVLLGDWSSPTNGKIKSYVLESDGTLTLLQTLAGDNTGTNRGCSAITADGTFVVIAEGGVRAIEYAQPAQGVNVRFASINSTGQITFNAIPMIQFPLSDAEGRVVDQYKSVSISPNGEVVALHLYYFVNRNAKLYREAMIYLLKRNTLGNYEIYRKFDIRDYAPLLTPALLSTGAENVSVQDSPPVLAVSWVVNEKGGVQIFR